MAIALSLIWGQFSLQSPAQQATGLTIDLAVQSASTTILGKGSNFELGTSLAVGDLDGDGQLDLVVGAAGGSGPDGTRPAAGEIHVFLGRNGFSATLDLATKPGDVVLYGRMAGDRLGEMANLVVADVNGDGIDDLVAGIRAGNGPDGMRASAGEVEVIFGRRDLGGAWDLSTRPADVVVYGAERLDWLGQRVVVGDVNADKIADLVIAAPLADGPENRRPSCGEVAILHGGQQLKGVIDLSTQMPDVLIYGADAGDLFGSSLAVGDLNGDRVADLAVASLGGDGPGNSRGELTGEIQVIFGQAMIEPTIDLALRAVDWIVYGRAAQDILGFAMAAADVSGDGIADLIVSAPRADGPSSERLSAGEVYVFYGSSTPIQSYDLLRRAADLTIDGADQGDGLGFRLATWDINGDQIADLVVSANGGDGPNNGRGEATGEVYVIFTVKPSEGQLTVIKGAIDLFSQPANITIYGSQASQAFGYSVAVGDFNKDGVGDLVAGAMNYSDPDGQRPSAGSVYLVSGRDLKSAI